MTQETQKSNNVLIVVAIIGVIGTIATAAIAAFASYNTTKMAQDIELTRIALASTQQQGGITQGSNVFTQNFDGADGSFDTNVWVCPSGSCNAQNVFQQNGTLVFKFNTLEISPETWGVFMKSEATWKMGNLISLEGKLQIGTKTKGGTWLGLDNSSKCSIRAKPDVDIPIIYCDLSSGGTTEYSTPDLQVEFDKWYLIRIDYDPITQEQKYYLDNNLIGRHTPKSSPDLASVSLGAWREQNQSVDAYIDNVVVRSRP